MVLTYLTVFVLHFIFYILHLLLYHVYDLMIINNKPGIEYEHSLTFRVRRYVVIATKPVHRLQIRPVVHN